MKKVNPPKKLKKNTPTPRRKAIRRRPTQPPTASARARRKSQMVEPGFSPKPSRATTGRQATTLAAITDNPQPSPSPSLSPDPDTESPYPASRTTSRRK